MAPKMLMSIFPSFILLLFLGGCSVGPDYEKPQITTDDVWQESSHISLTTKPLKDIAWWSYFHDPILDHLIQEAVKNNLDIEAALAKIRQIRANVSKSIANLFPTITGNAAIQENKESMNTASSSELGTYRVFEAGYNTSWELDLFGKMRRATESENSLFESSIEDGRSIILTRSEE
ncbi:TolC family protein, partial [uncultured Acinetobacter sp.]|uniref:TolC family protein n=1 Tax=uncultured Acinetobacter sp. TaxID=165433 RepID=UPI002633E8FA